MKEERRVSITTEGNKKVMLLTQLITLTGSQEQKLNCEQLLPELEKIAKKLEIYWAIELSANIEYGTLAVSRTHENEIGNCEFSSIEKAAKEFLDAVDKLALPEPECPSNEPDDEEKAQDAETLEFVKELLNDINLPPNDDSRVRGALIIDTTTSPFCPELTCWGRLSYNLLKEMCQLYIKAYEND